MGNSINTTNSTYQLAGTDGTNGEDSVDGAPNLIIGAFAVAVTSWSFVSMFADNMISTCGFSFGSWSCAGFTSTWIAAWAVGGIEFIFWTIGMLVPSFRPIWYELANIWTYAGAVLHLVPIIWWIIALSTESVPVVADEEPVPEPVIDDKN